MQRKKAHDKPYLHSIVGVVFMKFTVIEHEPENVSEEEKEATIKKLANILLSIHTEEEK